MKQNVQPDSETHVEVRHHKPGHLAEKLESYVGVGIVMVGAILLILMLFAFPQTGTGTPGWMR